MRARAQTDNRLLEGCCCGYQRLQEYAVHNRQGQQYGAQQPKKFEEGSTADKIDNAEHNRHELDSMAAKAETDNRLVEFVCTSACTHKHEGVQLSTNEPEMLRTRYELLHISAGSEPEA
jgi:hypothetical protein